MPLDIPLEDSIHGQLAQAVQRIVEQLGLPFLPTNNIVIRKLAQHDENLPLPYCFVVPAEVSNDRNAGPTSRERYEYTVLVAFVTGSNRDASDATLGTQLYWAQKCRRAFQNKDETTLLGGVQLPAGYFLCRSWLESGVTLDERAFAQMYDAQYHRFRFLVDEPRT